MISMQSQLQGPQQNAECKEHGSYVSTFWTMPMPHGDGVSSWTGCPACVREHFAAKRGYGKARFKFAHRPSYEVVTIANGIEKREEVHG
jgi:hypothetical protein